MVVDNCEEVIKWIDTNKLAEKQKIEEKLTALQSICAPIITAVVRAARANNRREMDQRQSNKMEVEDKKKKI